MSNTRKLHQVRNIIDFHRRADTAARKESRRTTLRIYHGYHRQQVVDERERRNHA